MVKMTKVEGIVNAEVRSGGSGGSGGSGEETPVRAVVIRRTIEVEGKLALSLSTIFYFVCKSKPSFL